MLLDKDADVNAQGGYYSNALYTAFTDSYADERSSKIRRWLSAPDPSTNYQKALKLRQADTGLWLLESDTYKRWKTAATSPLWLYGIPGCGKTILSSTVLQNVLQHCQDDPGKVTAYFFFDFNDVQKQDPEMMIRSLVWQLQSLHLMVTSRRERDIEVSLEGFVNERSRVCFQSTLVDKDIQRYVRQRLSDDKRLQKWEKDTSMIEQIETALTRGAKGMFRWAVCQLDALGKCVNRKMLQQALTALPPTLDQTYDRILAAIENEYSQYALRILQWLTFSARPLSIDEVAEVVAIDVKREPIFDRKEVLEDPLEVLNICSSLVTMTVDNDYQPGESPRQVVVLAHYSVKEYLISQKAVDLCSKENYAYANWIRLWNPDRPWGEPELQKDSEEILNPLYYAALLDLRDVVKTLLDTGADINAQGGRYGNALQAASYRGHKAVVKLLLDKDADGGHFGNALQAASWRGSEAVVKVLLEKGAEVNAQGGQYGNAL
ncbi:ankyrin [Polyplosphaeria fusca]|uniref:Ankyrin n=1 Tax=Polyplosphaeria fusca TaxID=682080 RepID=A0A9P4R114_9PLEO|nr:ankyrin [Polyplosphaeria fusca]